MGLFFIYILKASVCLALFYLFYKVLLSKETFHRFNRMALLGTVVLSFFLPAIKIAVSEPTALNRTVSDLESLLMLAELHAEAGTTETVVRVGWQEAAVGIYLIGVVFFCLKNLIGIGRMLILIWRNRKERLADGSVLVHCTEKTAPFSWMKYIVVSEKDLQEDCTPILAHEQAHIRLRHSWDILIAQACIIVQWFNPAAWLVKQELQAVHEYEADSEVLRRGVNAKEYQLLLIKKAVGARLYSLANSLNHSSLKKRITMMMRKKSNPWARAKYLYVLPLAAIAVAAFARPEISEPLNEISRVKVTDLSAITITDDVKSIETNQKDIEVTGIVCDVKGKPIIGAIVLAKGSSKGVVTDSEGKFTIQTQPGSPLEFMYIGYATQTLKAEEGKKLEVTLIEENKEEPYTMVEQMPQFPGGMKALMEYISTNLRYPEEAKDLCLHGRVIIGFTVKEDGSITDVKVVRSLHPIVDAEAVRVISKMPKWQPGMQDGKPVPVKYTVPVILHEHNGEKSDSTIISFNSGGVLILVDGKEFPTKDLFKLDSNTIEKIEVLKDPSKTAPYGEKGKFGVMLITTKKK